MVDKGRGSLLRTPTLRGTRVPWVREVLSYGAALLGVVAVSLVVAQVAWLQLANVSLLYIVVVLLAAVLAGRGPAIVAAVAAFLSFNYFLTEPRLTFAVADPDDWLGLLLFLAVALISGQLAADQRRRAEEAAEHERHAMVLYELAEAIADPDLGRALGVVADRVRREVDGEAVQIELGGHVALATRDGDLTAGLALERRDGAPEDVLAAAGGTGGATRWVRVSPPHGVRRGAVPPYRLARVPIMAPDGEAGAILAATAPGTPLGDGAGRLLASVAGQLWVALERSRLRDDATEAEVLRRSDEAKSALIDAVSHDLRTPLASIIASAGSLQQRDVEWSGEERQAFAGAIEEEARRLNRIVGNLLDLGRIRAGAIHPDTAWYEPVALIRDVAGRVAPMTIDGPQRMVLELPDELPPVPLDYSMVDQILTNLLENALKFSSAGSTVRVTAEMTDGALQVSVEDSGPGLAPAERKRVFEPFYRVRGSSVPGSGLGLAIASGLVRAHGGELCADARAGGGTRFTFTIPGEEVDATP